MRESFDPGRENSAEVTNKHGNWVGQQLKSLLESSPLLQDWKESDRKFEAGATIVGMAGSAIIAGAAVYGDKHPLDQKFVAGVLAFAGGAVLLSEITARTARFLREKFGTESKEGGK